MKVDSPDFDQSMNGQCWCPQCPFEDRTGEDTDRVTKCGEWVNAHGKCPTAETYAEACAFAGASS